MFTNNLEFVFQSGVQSLCFEYEGAVGFLFDVLNEGCGLGFFSRHGFNRDFFSLLQDGSAQ